MKIPCEKCPAICCKAPFRVILPPKEEKKFSNVSDEIKTKFRTLHQLRKINGICVYLKNNKCEIYKKRPFECRAFPFVMTFEVGKLDFYIHESCPFSKNVSRKDLTSLRKFVKKLPVDWINAYESIGKD